MEETFPGVSGEVMWTRKLICVVTCLTAIVLLLLGVGAGSTSPSGRALAQPASATGSRSGIRWAVEPTTNKADLAKIQKVLVAAAPDLDVVSQFCEDVLAVELMGAKISVVSRERRDRETILKLIELEEQEAATDEAKKEPAKKKPPGKSKDKLADVFAVGEATKADALVVVNLVTSTAQQNLFDKEGVRVTEVRTELSVRACSVTVVEVGTGRLLLAGFVGYEQGVSLLEAAREFGEGLVKQLR